MKDKVVNLKGFEKMLINLQAPLCIVESACLNTGLGFYQ